MDSDGGGVGSGVGSEMISAGGGVGSGVGSGVICGAQAQNAGTLLISCDIMEPFAS